MPVHSAWAFVPWILFFGLVATIIYQLQKQSHIIPPPGPPPPQKYYFKCDPTGKNCSDPTQPCCIPSDNATDFSSMAECQQHCAPAGKQYWAADLLNGQARTGACSPVTYTTGYTDQPSCEAAASIAQYFRCQGQTCVDNGISGGPFGPTHPNADPSKRNLSAYTQCLSSCAPTPPPPPPPPVTYWHCNADLGTCNTTYDASGYTTEALCLSACPRPPPPPPPPPPAPAYACAPAGSSEPCVASPGGPYASLGDCQQACCKARGPTSFFCQGGNQCCDSNLCQGCVNGTCQSICPQCSTCVNGICKPNCDTQQCTSCSGTGTCISDCSPNECQVCDGKGHCTTQCSVAQCQVCDGQGHCKSQCDTANCYICNGQGNCIPKCSGCETCDGQGNCLSKCDTSQCQTCDPTTHECLPSCSLLQCQKCNGQGLCTTTCGPCETCNGNGVCQSTCSNCQTCGPDGKTCTGGCNTNQCQTCTNNICQSNCSAIQCQVCDGQGHCVSQCNNAQCQMCDGNGNCKSKCDAANCYVCDGQGHCVPKCNGCDVCDGQGNCKPKCDVSQCETCVNGVCTISCTGCQKCDGNGTCVTKCDVTKCETCDTTTNQCVNQCRSAASIDCPDGTPCPWNANTCGSTFPPTGSLPCQCKDPKTGVYTTCPASGICADGTHCSVDQTGCQEISCSNVDCGRCDPATGGCIKDENTCHNNYYCNCPSGIGWPNPQCSLVSTQCSDDSIYVNNPMYYVCPGASSDQYFCPVNCGPSGNDSCQCTCPNGQQSVLCSDPSLGPSDAGCCGCCLKKICFA